MSRPLALSDKQLATLRHAAASLPERERYTFVQSVAQHLTGEPSDTALDAAIQIALGKQSTSVFMTDQRSVK